MAAQMVEKFEQYWEVNKIVMAFASILDPRYKTKSVECFFRVLYKDPYESKARIDNIQTSFIRLYNEYAAPDPTQTALTECLDVLYHTMELVLTECLDVSALTKCLDVLYHTMKKLSTVENPTANLYFNEICAIHLLLEEWCTNRYPVVATMAAQMVEKFKQYWKVNKIVMAFASILDPRYKTKSVEYFFRVLYKDPYESKARIDNIQTSFIMLYSEYAAQSSGQSKNEPVFYKGTEHAGTVTDSDSGVDYFGGGARTHNKTFSRIKLSDAKRGLDQYLEETSCGQTVKSDLDLYLEEAVLTV